MTTTAALVDSAVIKALARSDGSLTAPQIASRFGVSTVAATHCLQRLAKQGIAQVTAETVAKPGRVSEIVLHYQVKPKRNMGLPSWLDPRQLPKAVASVRRHTLPMPGWGADEECEVMG